MPDNENSRGCSELVDQAWSSLSAGNAEEAAEICERVLAEAFDGRACHALGLARWTLGENGTAVGLLAEAAASRPADAALHSDLGVLSILQRDWSVAARAFETCLKLWPRDLTARQGRASALFQLRRYDESARVCEAWMEADPDEEAAAALLVRCLLRARRLDEAEVKAQDWLARKPRSETMLSLLGSVYQAQQRFEAALRCAKSAVEAHPDSGDAWASLAGTHWAAGDPEAAGAARARALELGASDFDSWRGLNWLSLFDPAQTAAGLLEVHRVPPSAPVAGRAPAGHSNSLDSERRLRVGYVSGEFISSAAYCFLIPWLCRHDPAQVETFYYMTRPWGDQHTAQFQTLADHWRDVPGLDENELEAVIRKDRIDILVDLSGHFQHNRLSVFTRRPAPVQATFPNYPGTTGVEEIDYIFTDKWTTPAGCEEEYAEQPYRLPSGYIDYRAAEVPIQPLPAASDGYLTFGMFQRPGKLHKAVWEVIGEILRRTPESRLLIHFGSEELDEEGSEQRLRLTRILEGHGVDRGRMVFRGSRISPQHLAVVGEADIALDAFPYNGQTTTCDCLWMGVPVISLRGHTHVSRVTPALLDRLELGELAAETPAGYVEQAVRLAGDLNRLAALRTGLREKMTERGMTGGARLAREIEQAYRTMWRRWCASQGRSQATGTGG